MSNIQQLSDGKKSPFPFCPGCKRRTIFQSLYTAYCPSCDLKIYNNYICVKCDGRTELIGWCESCEGNYYKEKFQEWDSGNPDINKFLQRNQSTPKYPYSVLEWVDYQNLDFSNGKPLGEGGFGYVRSALWLDGPRWFFNRETNEWARKGPTEVALKFLNCSQNITSDFFLELETMIRSCNPFAVARISGISQDRTSTEKNYIIIMEKYPNGSLRNYWDKMKEREEKIENYKKDQMLRKIIFGLNVIHSQGLIHCDLHPGNILVNDDEEFDCLIADFGLCKPADKPSTKVFGVTTFIAPEVLRGGPFTEKSDVYSIGMIIWSLFAEKYPFSKDRHEYLVCEICKGARPPTPPNIPPLWETLMTSLWDTDPENRPTMHELQILLYDMSVGDRFKLVELGKLVATFQQELDKIIANQTDYEKGKESLIQSCDNLINTLPIVTYLTTACKSLKIYLEKLDQGDEKINKRIKDELKAIRFMLSTCVNWHAKIQKITELREIRPIESQDSDSDDTENEKHYPSHSVEVQSSNHSSSSRNMTDEDDHRIQPLDSEEI